MNVTVTHLKVTSLTMTCRNFEDAHWSVRSIGAPRNFAMIELKL